jgi:hypothetical protein
MKDFYNFLNTQSQDAIFGYFFITIIILILIGTFILKLVKILKKK